MLYKETKAMVGSPDSDTDFFDIVAGILQRDKLALFLFIMCLDYVTTSIDLMIENGFTIKKKKEKKRAVDILQKLLQMQFIQII